jgi:hypothetical protein
MTAQVQDTEKLAAEARQALLGAGLQEAPAGPAGRARGTGFTVSEEPGAGTARAAVRWLEDGTATGGDIPSQGIRACLAALCDAGLQARYVPAFRRGCLITWRDE